MKVISSGKIARLSEYFRKKKLLKKTPRVLALVLSDEELKAYQQMTETLKEHLSSAGQIKYGTIRSKHEFWDATGLHAVLVHLRGLPDEIVFPQFCKQVLHIKKPSKYEYAIFIREGSVYVGDECSFCPAKHEDNCANLLGYLTHEFIHIVEREIGKRMLPEEYPDYYYVVGDYLIDIFPDAMDIEQWSEITSEKKDMM